ncbi:MAG: hypothetical protein K9L66_06845 [Spirochaetaceae bacterium]|nr:hypothetical protein [Spirochaetaceae bacterium]MCF7948555.1 hypothetical protein [Spirochaetia bacterium]MCF7951244.1 hypothetical protein [Spirochaetaceae bacterium]
MSTGIIRVSSRITQGYIAFLKGFLRVLAFSLGVAGISALITLPLWYWATNGRTSFTIAVLIVCATGFLVLLTKHIGNSINDLRSQGLSTASILILPMKRIVKVLATLILIYLTLIVFGSVSLLAGIACALLSIGLIGFLFFAQR